MSYAKTAVTQVAAPTTTIQQKITIPHLTWTPKAAIFIATSGTVNTTAAATAKISYGCATGPSNQWAASIRSADNQATTDTARKIASDACIVLFADTGLTIDGVAEFISFGAGSVTIEWTNAPAAAVLVTVVLISCDNAEAGIYEMAATSGITTVTLGWAADVMLAGYVEELVDVAATGAMLSLGVAHYDGSNIYQRSHTLFDSHGQAATAVTGRLDTDYIVIEHGGSVSKASEITSFTSTTIVATQRVADAVGEAVGYLALDLGDSAAAIGTYTTPTSKQYHPVTGVGFRPGFVMFGLFNGAAVDTDYSDHQAGSIGIGVATADTEYANTYSSEDNEGTTDSQSLTDDAAANLPNDDGAEQFDMTLTRMDNGGFTLWPRSTLSTGSKVWWYLAIQRDPVAEFGSMRLYNPDAKLRAILTDAIDYSLLHNSWSPAVSGDKPGQMGGKPFNQVVESFAILVSGGDREEVLDNLERLYYLLKLAEDWAQDMTAGVTETATIFQWEAQGSSEGAWESLVVGRADQSANLLGLPRKFSEDLVLKQIDIQLDFVREGELLGDKETPAASASAPSGDLMTVTFTNNLTIPSPVHLTVAGFGGGGGVLQQSYLFIVRDAADIAIIDAETAGAGTTIDEDANKARGTATTNAQQFTGAGTYDVAAMLVGSSPIRHNTTGIYGLVRKEDAAASWRMYCTTKEASGVVNGQTRHSVLSGSSVLPQVHFFGTVQSAGKDHTQLLFYYLEKNGTDLTIDYFVLIGMDNPINRVIRLRPSADVAGIENLVVDPRQLTNIAPRVTANNSSPQTFSVPWDNGEAYTQSNGLSLSAVLMAPRSNYWRWTLGSTLQNFTLTATRQRAVLTPR